jgi:hypothetical protein
MKKILFLLAMTLAIAMTSCTKTQFGLEYNVAVTGDGDGDFEVTFPQGSYAMNGTAAVQLTVGDTMLWQTQEYVLQNRVLQSQDADAITALRLVNDAMTTQFNATATSGTYDLLIDGYVTEIATGLTFSVHKRLTNRDSVPIDKLQAITDEYRFVR